MCLSTVYVNLEESQKEVMKDVAQVKAHERGYWLIDLFGEKTFVEGTLDSIDLVEGNLVILGNAQTA
jgi:predicted RNA-binding protein